MADQMQNAPEVLEFAVSGSKAAKLLVLPVQGFMVDRYGFTMAVNVANQYEAQTAMPMTNISRPLANKKSNAFEPTGSLDVRTKQLNPVPFFANIPYKSTDLYGANLMGMVAPGILLNDPSGTPIMDALIKQTIRGYGWDTIKRLFFGKKASVDQTSQGYDGVFSNIVTSQTDPNKVGGLVNVVPVTTATPLPANGSIDLFDALISAMPIEMQRIYYADEGAYRNQFAFFASPNVLNNYRNSSQAVYSTTSMAIRRDGLAGFYAYDNVELIGMTDWSLQARDSGIFPGVDPATPLNNVTVAMLVWRPNVSFACDTDVNGIFESWRSQDFSGEFRINVQNRQAGDYITNELIVAAIPTA